MQKQWLYLLTGLALVGLPVQVTAQSDIDPGSAYSWAENAGWIDWQSANGGLDGVQVSPTIMSGFGWGENIGWLNFGDGSPANGDSYSNSVGEDHGVNVLSNGDLAGLAWGENIGWVNFDTQTLGAERARLDSASGRLRGYAWGENIGWINLDDAASFIGVEFQQLVRADFNTDGNFNALTDALGILNFAFNGGAAPMCQESADANGDGAINGLTDALYMLTFGFSGGNPPPAPFPDCGNDPDFPNTLGCDNYLGCP